MTGSSATILGCAGQHLTPAEKSFFRQADPWGFILFARNLEDALQIRGLTEDLRATVGREAPVFIDQEGGRVQRLRPPLARDWLPPLDHLRAAGAQGARAMELRYRLIAAELRGLGIDGNCAPTLDIAGPQTHPFLLNRCLGASAEAVAAMGAAAARGMLAGGVLPVIKHIPGHGRATADSHLTLPVVTEPAEVLEATDFVPFRALAHLPLAMTAHLVYAALDPDLPATLSPRVMAAIRGQIGFEGLVMTDDMSMRALSGDIGALTAAAIAAGCDVALHCNGDMVEMEAVVIAAGRLQGEGARRADAALAQRVAPDDADPAALLRELQAIGGG